MAKLEVRFRDYYVVGSYPDNWYLSRRAVPNLVVPREIFALSNRPIRPTPVASSQPRPMISSLDSASIFVWCYYQAEGDPGDHDPIPDYRSPSYPLSYHRSEVMAASDAREWDSSKFLWRRLGFNQDGIKVTIWIWQGTTVSSTDLRLAERAVESFRITRAA